MKKKVLFGTVFFAFMAFGGEKACLEFPLSPSSTGKPEAVCPKPSFNWGKIFRGQPIKHTYAILNQGNAKLRIKRVTETCRCTTSHYTETVPAGGRGSITLQFHTEDFKGKVAKKAVVYTNDPENKRLVLSFEGIVRDFIKFSPVIPTLRGLIGEKPPQVSVEITKACEVPVRRIKVVSKPKNIETHLEEVKNESTYLLHIEACSHLGTVNTTERVKLRAEGANNAVFVFLTVHISLKRRIHAVPKWVVFRHYETARWERDPRKVPSKTVQVKGAEGITFRIKKVTTRGNFFVAELLKEKGKRKAKSRESGNSYTIRVKIGKRPGERNQPAHGSLEIHTTDPVAKKIKLPVMAFFKTRKK